MRHLSLLLIRDDLSTATIIFGLISLGPTLIDSGVPLDAAPNELEKAVAVRNSLLERFSGKCRRCWKTIPRFPAARNAIPAKVWTLSGKETAAGKLAAPAGMLLDLLLRDRHSLL